MGQVGFDGLVEFTQVVAGHRGNHVMLAVEIHVREEEAHKRIEVDRAAAQAIIVHVVHQSDVLGVITQVLLSTKERYQSILRS